MGPIVSWPDQSRQFCSAVCSLTISELNVNATNGIPYCWCFRNPTNHHLGCCLNPPCNDFQYPFSVIFQNSFIHRFGMSLVLRIGHLILVPGSLRTTPAEPNSRVRWTAEQNIHCVSYEKASILTKWNRLCYLNVHIYMWIYIYVFIRHIIRYIIIVISI